MPILNRLRTTSYPAGRSPMNIFRANKGSVKNGERQERRFNYIFRGKEHGSPGEMWEAEGPDADFKLQKTTHSSQPYHKGCTTLYPVSFSSATRLKTLKIIANAEGRDLTSPFEETVFYWRNLATDQEIRNVRESSVNSASHILKYIGHHWIHASELISPALAQSKYFSDDSPATRPKHMNTGDWRREFYKVVEASHNINSSAGK
ncbi:hypothetical protein A1O7_03968 [Cladophialophora yegresii CBS 114405]|uniref:Uncharacterized protein n=1 Tax=Cladophialophora yegresii CBS 114405 TaxID=1182544 RepID=W9W5K1_9EURO|nr:uncharacterized protein A1O7_03968 [Cladophialophora yegresii CBS 114405]EXJ59821.1 hypothetical protein A1O7_03968 [Cladophialophora yegresii CBS 114405]